MMILAATRTPFCRMGSDLAPLSAVDLGRHALSSLLAHADLDPAEISEVIIGCVGQPSEAQNLARVIALRAGIPEAVPAMTVHRNCASGFEALTTAAERIAARKGELFVVGGVESMSNYPLQFSRQASSKFGHLMRSRGWWPKMQAIAAFRPADFRPVPTLKLGLADPTCGLNMGQTAEILAREAGISREAQDAFAHRSHLAAHAAREQLQKQISAIPLQGRSVSHDLGPRPDSQLAELAKLRPVFDREHGSVTAGNSSQISDGAVMLLVASDWRAEQLDLEPLGRLHDWCYVGCEPKRMGLGPVPAITRLLEQNDLSVELADVIEINEAFAAQVLAVCQKLPGLDPERINRWGGAIALGHPVGASGARLVQNALHQLQHNGGSNALCSLCVGGGQGAALWLQRP